MDELEEPDLHARGQSTAGWVKGRYDDVLVLVLLLLLLLLLFLFIRKTHSEPLSLRRQLDAPRYMSAVM